jgi:molybdopterin-binding protein
MIQQRADAAGEIQPIADGAMPHLRQHGSARPRRISEFGVEALAHRLPLAEALYEQQVRSPFRISYRAAGEVNAEITVDIGEGKTVTAVTPKESADSMALAPGAEVWAQFKPSHVILAANYIRPENPNG